MTKPPKRTASELRSTAYHEAAHAVIGRVLTLPCGRATIKPNYGAGDAGLSITPDPWACRSEWEKRGKDRALGAELHARIMTYMAGAEAQKELGLEEEPCGDGDDRRQIELMAEELRRGADWARLEPRLRSMTRMLVRRHRPLIERAAKALLRRKAINGKELDKIIGRSINDVKVNAPFLLFANRQK